MMPSTLLINPAKAGMITTPDTHESKTTLAGPEGRRTCADGVIEGSRFPPDRSSSCPKSQAISSIDSQS